MDTTIKMVKEKNKPEKKEESENKGKTVTQNLKCDQCHFGGIDQTDLKKHKDIKHKNANTIDTLALQSETWLGRCGICKFRTTDRAHFKRHMETFVHKTNSF